MIGIQIQLESNWKRSGDIVCYFWRFTSNIYDKMDNIGKLIKLKIFLIKSQIQRKAYKYNTIIREKESRDIFGKNWRFLYNISDKIMEIYEKMLNFEDFCGNFHRYNGRYTNK